MLKVEWKNNILLTFAVAAAYLLVSWINYYLFKSGGVLPMPIWPAAGLAIAVCLRYGVRSTPGIWLGALLANHLIIGSTWQVATLIGLSNSFAPLLAVFVISSVFKAQNPFEDLRSYLVFLFIAVILHPALTASGGISAQLLLNFLQPDKANAAWLGWWFAHSTGTILFGPIFYSLMAEQTEIPIRKKHEYLLVFVLTFLVTLLIFSTENPFPAGTPYLLIIPMAYVAVRYSMLRSMMLFALVIVTGMTGIVINPAIQLGSSSVLMPFRMLAISFSVVLVMLSILRKIHLATEKNRTYSENQYRRLTENSPAVIFQFKMTPEGKFSFPFINSAVTRILKLETDEIKQNAGRLLEKIHPEDADEFIACVMHSAQTLQPYHQIFRHVADDEIIWLEVNSSPDRLEDGTILWDGILFNITERISSEEALKKKSEELETYFSSTLDLFCIADTNGNFLRVSNSWENTLGYCIQDLEGKKFLDFVHPEDIEDTLAAVSQLQNQEEVINFTNRYRTSSGDYRYIEWKSSPKGTLIIAAARDITERLAAEKQLKKSGERLQTVMDSIESCIYIADMQTHEILFINQYAKNAWGKDITGEICYKAIQNLDKPCPFCTNDKLLTDEGKPAEPYKWEFKNNFNNKWYQIVDRAIYWTDGRIVRMEAATDITEIKQAQQIIASKNKELEQLIYVASHDLRSPLVNVDGYSRELEFALEDLKNAMNDEQKSDTETFTNIQNEMKSALSHIRNSTRQMDSLLKGLLKLSRLGRAALNICPVDMNELMAEIVSGQAFAAKNTGATLCTEKLPLCMGDKVQISQVFANLIGNAIKFLDPDRPGKILITGKKENGRSIYCVEDNGIGISRQHKDNIFQLFHRLNPGKTEGEGLGLTIVKQILSMIDGEIYVESVSGQGSRFYVSLPHCSEGELLL